MECSVNFMMDCIRKIHATDRWFSSDKMWRTCRTVESIMGDIGLTEIKTLSFPSDGKTDFGGWVMPLCWDAEEATLEIVTPDVHEPLLCQYSQTPCSLMLNSRPADITAEVVMAGSGSSVKGKFVLVTDEFPGLDKTIAWLNQGAAGIISSFLGGDHFGKTGFEFLNDSCQWHNYVIPHWRIDGDAVGFSLSPRQGERLSSLLKDNRKLRLRASVKTRLYPGKLPLVTGLLKGETAEEIIITGHLFEQGADDNASGVALALGIVEAFKNTKLKRGIRLLFTYEARSLQAYLQGDASSFSAVKAGINVDMVGFSGDKKVSIGGNRPVFPNYSVALLQHIFSGYPEFTTAESDFGAVDNALGEPQIGVPLPCVLLMDDPHYHKSTDVPDTISPELLGTMAEVIGQYVSFLGNAGYAEARELARLVYKAETDRLRKMAGDKGFALVLAKQSLDSIKTLAPSTDRLLASLQRKLDAQFKVGTEAPAPVIQDADALQKIVPRKAFRGFFSFEKYLGRKAEFESIREVIRPWCAPAWVNYTLMWSDGERTALEILRMLLGFGIEVPPKLFIDLLGFMEHEGYLAIGKPLDIRERK